MSMAGLAAVAAPGMTVISRLERLDLILLCLEEIKAGRCGSEIGRVSSGVSTASSGGDGLLTVTDGENSSECSSLENRKGYRNMEEVILETEIKGSIIDRIILLESRLLQVEEKIKVERKREMKEIHSPNKNGEKKEHNALKSIVKSCFKGNLNTKD